MPFSNAVIGIVMKRRLLTTLLLICSLLSHAQTLTGHLGEHATYTIRDNVLTISGTGDLPDYAMKRDSKTATITFTSPLMQPSVLAAMQAVTAVRIEDGITSIGDYTMALSNTTAMSFSFPCTLVPTSKTMAIQVTAYTGTITVLAPANSEALTHYERLINKTTAAKFRTRTGQHADVQPVPAVTVTCTTGGCNLYYHCNGCGLDATTTDFATLTSAQEQRVEALGHAMTQHQRVEPTCEESGTIAYCECTRCNLLFADAEGSAPATDLAIAPLGHQPVYHEMVYPTCTQSGTIACYECTRCSHHYRDEACTDPLTDISIPAQGHRAVYVSYSDATCGRVGNEAYYRCPDCGGFSISQVDCRNGVFADSSAIFIPKKPHTSIYQFQAIAPTCTSSGRNAYYRCNICYVQSMLPDCSVPADPQRDISLPALGHELVHHEAAAATCTNYGHTDYERCSRCSKYFTINAETGEPEDALYSQFRTDEPLGHDMTENPGYKATCTADGLRQHYHCDRCDNYFLSTTSPFPVDYAELIIPASHIYTYRYGANPSCTAAGSQGYYTCWECRTDFVRESDGTYTVLLSQDDLYLPPLGHTIVHLSDQWVTSSATGMPEMWYCSTCRKYGCDADLTIAPTAEYIYQSALLGDGTQQSPYVIATEGDLRAMALASNLNWNTTGLYFDITRNITVTGDFQPIATANGTNAFAGTIRGHHHAITFDDANAILQGTSKGFIGKANEATISNLTLRGTIEWNIGYQSHVGTFCGQANYCQFQGLRNYVGCSSNFLATAFGGIVGYANECNLLGCENHAPLANWAQYFGGLVGQAQNCNIRSSSNSGSITTGGPSMAYVGGLVGSISGGLLGNCYNASYVGENLNSSGKFMGYFFGTLNSGNVFNCLYEGEGTLQLGYGQTSGTTTARVTNCHTKTLQTNLDALNATARNYGFEPWVRNTVAGGAKLLFEKQQPHYIVDDAQTTVRDLTLIIRWLSQDNDADLYWQCDFNKDGLFDLDDMEDVLGILLK